MKKFFAVLLSILLVCTLVTLPLCTGVIKLFSKETVTDLIDEADLTEIISDIFLYEETNDSMLAKKLDKSEYLDELVDECTELLIDALYGESKKFDEEDFIELAEKNIDELTSIAKTAVPEYSDFTYEQTETAILTAITDTAPEFTEEINSVIDKLSKSGFTEIISIIKIITYVSIAVAIILTILIFWLTYKKFSGFFWISSNCIIAAILTIPIRIVINKILIPLTADLISYDELEELPNLLFGKIIGEYDSKTLIYVIIFVLCLCVGITCKVILSRKKKLAANTSAPQENTGALQ